MSPSELIPGQIYVVNRNGFRRNLKFIKKLYATSPSGGVSYRFVPASQDHAKNERIDIHEKKIEAAVEYPRYTQLGLNLV